MTASKLPEGFIWWHGGPCPVPGKKVIVALRCDPDPDRTWDWAVDFDWSHSGDPYDIVAYKVIEEAKPSPTGHPHAELMAQYAEDARTTPAPWTLWEWRSDEAQWQGLRSGHNPSWHVNVQYRRKPVPKGPTHCPFCGGSNVQAGVEWSAKSTDPTDKENSATLTEYTCRNESCGRSFWS